MIEGLFQTAIRAMTSLRCRSPLQPPSPLAHQERRARASNTSHEHVACSFSRAARRRHIFKLRCLGDDRSCRQPADACPGSHARADAASPGCTADFRPQVLTPGGDSDGGRCVHQAEVEQRVVAWLADVLRGLLQSGANLRWCKARIRRFC